MNSLNEIVDGKTHLLLYDKNLSREENQKRLAEWTVKMHNLHKGSPKAKDTGTKSSST